jgi:hypothetical protein
MDLYLVKYELHFLNSAPFVGRNSSILCQIMTGPTTDRDSAGSNVASLDVSWLVLRTTNMLRIVLDCTGLDDCVITAQP